METLRACLHITTVFPRLFVIPVFYVSSLGRHRHPLTIPCRRPPSSLGRLCLTGSPCFGSIADVVQSHGGVFMDSSNPTSPVPGPHSRGLRRASEVSMASQVSGMADSYTATNIANSKLSPPTCCTPLSPSLSSLSLSLSLSHSQKTLSRSLHSLSLSFLYLSFFSL